MSFPLTLQKGIFVLLYGFPQTGRMLILHILKTTHIHTQAWYAAYPSLALLRPTLSRFTFAFTHCFRPSLPWGLSYLGGDETLL